MKWKVVARPQVAVDIIAASEWYDSKREGLGDEFIEEVLTVFDLSKSIRYCTAAGTTRRIFVGDILRDFLIVLFTKLSRQSGW